jgi:hypothetical protein
MIGYFIFKYTNINHVELNLDLGDDISQKKMSSLDL